MGGVLVTTMCEIPGYRVIEILGVVSAGVVKARHLGKDIVATLRGVVGGEIKEYSELLASARREALERLAKEAESRGANAVVCVRLATSAIASMMAEVLAYGTAVVVEPVEG
ncbi:MAG: YbjQ family protein [Desulfurococcales archaeon]|nr:YbjQ family protein [Desulfurococcales archaeon]